MAPKKRIAIVGAGASGLPAIRHSLLYNLDVTCFEGSGYVGGLWRYKPEETDESSVMKTTVINTSKEMTAYSDFPPPAHMANFMHNTEMYKYLQLYAEQFDLTKYIKFHHRVTNVERSDNYKKDGTWKVSYTDEQGNDASEIFDSVLICSGHHAEPHFPKKWPGQDTFTGKTIHSHSYKDHRGYEDKVVVVVGVGNSGGDVAVELSRIAKQLFSFDGLTASTWFAFRIHYHLHPDHPSVHNRGRKQELIVRTKTTVSEDPSKVNDSIAFIDDLFITKDNIYIGVASVFKDTKKVITVIVPELRCEKGVLKPLAQQVVNHASFHFDLTLLGESNSNCSRICVFPFVRVSIVNRTSETFKGREWCGGIEDAKKLIKFSTNYPHLLYLCSLLVITYILFT